MTKTTITTLTDPHGFSADPLTDILHAGARDLIKPSPTFGHSSCIKTGTVCQRFTLMASVARIGRDKADRAVPVPAVIPVGEEFYRHCQVIDAALRPA